MAQRYRSNGAPSRTAEYLLYQTLVGAHPLNADRASAYMLKAAREAKQDTSWLDPAEAYEAALDAFVRGVVEDSDIDADVARFVAAMTPAWHTAALSQTLLKLTSPGVADIYQGSELWDLRLVDPDNRTPVDFALRRGLLREVRGLSAHDVMQRAAEGMPKLHVVRSSLRVRRDAPAVFGPVSWYRPLHATGSRAAHAVAYARGAGGEPAGAVTVAVRLAFTLNDDWGTTNLDLPEGSWRNAFTDVLADGGAIPLAELLRDFPVALLQRVS
ncbi:MAG TPA: malto-oligosyltrehalose synthase, partial [Candidatus Dormibacteraeota bacterium]|nr:malto-oligosyltrehalose synthase [Candidatus Dormibacteraeota bacterium]